MSKKDIIMIIIIVGLFGTMLSLLPLLDDNESPCYYEFNVTYVNNQTKTLIIELPQNFEYSVEGNKGTYYLALYSHYKDIWGHSWKGGTQCVYGVIYVNSVKRLAH